jgi:GNAT superfamily N-acetyltransferase
MEHAPPGLELRPIRIPPATDAADAADFVEMVRQRNLIYREISGHEDHDLTPEELLPHFRPDAYERRLAWLVLLEDEPVGRVGVDLPIEGDSAVAFWLVELRRHVWGRGIGTAAYALVERVAREHGRTVLQTWAEHEADAAGALPRLDAPTGFGSVPLDHTARFLVRHGYALEQIERNSVLDLADPDARLRPLRDAAAAAADGYRVVRWTAPTPPELADDYAWMKSRMATDAPSAGLEIDEEAWDAARVALHDARYTGAGRTLQVTAAQHVATGRLAAFNELVIGPDHAAASHQEDTLVLAEHRGHRLGMLVKCDGLLAWRERFPASRRVLTYNAEENRPMLDINETIGFVPLAYEGAWKKTLSADARAD